MNPLITRTISALLALGIFLAIAVFFRSEGLRFLCLLAVILGTRELIPILFKPDDSLTIKAVFYVLMICLFIFTVKYFSWSAVIFANIGLLFFMTSLVFESKFGDLTALSIFQAKSVLGFFYVGLLPSFSCHILDLPHGEFWFYTLLAIVFAGDTSAYLVGRVWGRKKLMPAVSPKKTVEGAIGGLFGSLLAGAGAGYLMSELQQPIWIWMSIGVIIGAIGQMGDLFESVLKRVADVKDSGTIMPGHGGILDRLDGVLFASPFVLLVAQFVNFFSAHNA